MIELPLFLSFRRRSRFPLRAFLCGAGYLLLGLFLPFPDAIEAPITVSTPIFFLSVLLFWVLFDISLRAALYVCTMAYLAQNMALNVMKICMVLSGLAYEQTYLLHLGTLLVFSLLAYLLLIRHWKLDLLDSSGPGQVMMLPGAVMALCIIITLGMLFRRQGLDYDILTRVTIIIASVFALGVQYYGLKSGRLEVEKQVIQELLAAERSQYRISRESIDIVNMKCHDLKHQIAAVRRGLEKESQEALREVEKAVSIYDAVSRTGSESLDAVLTEKILYCERHGILLTYMVDPGALNFLGETDLYALFGNILDNGIEAVMKEDRDRRVIALNIRRVQNMLSVHEENTCSVAPVFRDGLPVTTKTDHMKHGYGVRSSRYLAERYGGHVTFRAENGMFVLDILIPIPAASARP